MVSASFAGISALLLLSGATATTNTTTNHTALHDHRSLFSLQQGQEEFGFLVSLHGNGPTPFCATAPGKPNTGVQVVLRNCNFASAPAAQLWKLTADAQLASAKNTSMCLSVTPNGKRVRTRRCKSRKDLSTFTLDPSFGFITMASKPNKCLYVRGRFPKRRGALGTSKCRPGRRFQWTFVPNSFLSSESSIVPSGLPSVEPSAMPSSGPSGPPSRMPTSTPTTGPSSTPSSFPTFAPSDIPSSPPSDIPSSAPSDIPSSPPSDIPSFAPSDVPSSAPSDVPSSAPSDIPSSAPSDIPSSDPTSAPVSAQT